MKKAEADNWKELARLYAESKMPQGWDRHDEIHIGTFYGHYISYIESNYILIRMVANLPTS